MNKAIQKRKNNKDLLRNIRKAIAYVVKKKRNQDKIKIKEKNKSIWQEIKSEISTGLKGKFQKF